MKFTKKLKNISYTSTSFNKWFGDMDFPEVAEMEPLTSKKLPRNMNDSEILSELKPQEVTLSDVYYTLQSLNKNTWALFYVKDKDGVLRAVFIYWCDGGWGVSAYEVSDPVEWSAGRQVFSRNWNSDTLSSDPLTPSSFDPIDIVYIKYRDEFTGITCKHYGKKVTIETSKGQKEFVFKDSDKETVKKVCESILRLIDQK